MFIITEKDALQAMKHKIWWFRIREKHVMNSVLAGVSNSTINKNQIRILGSNIRPELLTDIIPKIDTNIDINSYALDFYNHGGLKIKQHFQLQSIN